MKMSVTFRSLLATQSPNARACSVVNPGSMSTASSAPEIKVLARGEKSLGSPFGSTPLSCSGGSLMNTSYVSLSVELMVVVLSSLRLRGVDAGSLPGVRSVHATAPHTKGRAIALHGVDATRRRDGCKAFAMLVGVRTPTSTTGVARGGRGARERILQAAEELFYARGIHATGVAALVEAAGQLPEVARLAQRHKQAFRDRRVAAAAEAGATDPEGLGRQLAVIFEGANALAASCNDADVFTDAQRAAKTLLDVALRTAPGG